MQNAPSSIQGAWESIKTIVAAGGKKTLAFCKKHWKAIVIVLVIIVAICLLIKYFGGSGTETVTNSEVAQKSINEINQGAKGMASVAKELSPDQVMDSLSSKAQSGAKELFGKINPSDISNKHVSFSYGNADGFMSTALDGGYWVSGTGYTCHFDKNGNLLDKAGKIIKDVAAYQEKLAASDPKFGHLKATILGNSYAAIQKAIKSGAIEVVK